jgi:hypothetical protein
LGGETDITLISSDLAGDPDADIAFQRVAAKPLGLPQQRFHK